MAVYTLMAQLTCPLPRSQMFVDRLLQLLVKSWLPLVLTGILLWLLPCTGPAVQLYLGFAAGRLLWDQLPASTSLLHRPQTGSPTASGLWRGRDFLVDRLVPRPAGHLSWPLATYGS